MDSHIESARRTALKPQQPTHGALTLINGFVVAEGRDQAFTDMWKQTSNFFRAQPGFVSLRMHRAVSPGAAYRYVNVAVWESAETFAAAHAQEEFRHLVSQPAWKEFPNVPALFEVVAEFGN